LPKIENVKAIAFDLFDTLITLKQPAVGTALDRLCHALTEQGIEFNRELFNTAYVKIARKQFLEAKESGVETHNRFWLSDTFAEQGVEIDPHDERLESAIRNYFYSFVEFAAVVPGTFEMLEIVTRHYKVGLLSNFTDGPGARNILEVLGLSDYFSPALISGELGYRKPHENVFNSLAEGLETAHQHIVYVGDNVYDDVYGATQSGLIPVWTTYARDNGHKRKNKIMEEPTHEPDPSVRRISNWSELLELLT